MSETIPARKDVPVAHTWKLEDIFESNEAWDRAYEALQTMPEKLAAYPGKLGTNARALYDFFRLEDELSVRLTALHSYANCRSDEDTTNSLYIDRKGKAIRVWVAVSEALAFAAPEIIGIREETLTRFYAECPALHEYDRSLYLIRRKTEHVLSPECETLLAATGEMAEGPENINASLMNADLTFPPVSDKDGQEHPLTNSTLVPLLMSADRTLRKNAFTAYYTQLGAFKNTIAASLDACFKQMKFYANARRYSSMLEASLFSHEIPVSVYHSLIEAVHENMDKMYAYVALRKKMLGVDSLHMYDVYTPLVEDAAEKISFETAKSTVLEALAVLGADYAALLQEGFDNRWIDVYENKGKRSGAYSTSVSRPHPYVLLNHKDDLDSMFTLAHEMGHALHSYHSTKYQPVSTSDYVIFVAEVASTCNEVLLMRYLLAHTEDKNKRIYLLNHFLDQFKGTLYRQTMFAEFELEMAQMCEGGEALTADALCEKYLALNRLYFGEEMVSDGEIALEWARIPHFFSNFYVFQYATGFSAAVAIANRILCEGQPAVDDYKKFLSSGSCADPISLLKIAGVDMSTPEPVNSALRLFGELVDELRTLTEQ